MSTSFILDVAFDFVLSTVFVKYYRLSCNTNITETFFFSQPVFWYVVLLGKKLIALHRGDNTLLFYFDICIKLKLSLNLNNGEMITSHLMFELYYKETFSS